MISLTRSPSSSTQPLVEHPADDPLGHLLTVKDIARNGAGAANPSRSGARCMVLMMSPRSLNSRKTASVSGDTAQRPGSTSVARPMRSNLRDRWISSARFCQSFKHVPIRPEVGELVAALLRGEQHAV